MHFIITYSIKPENHIQSMKRFLETGALPPEGIKLLGRWHEPSLSRGFMLVETPDPTQIGIWANRWADLIKLEVVPVLNDEEMQIALNA